MSLKYRMRSLGNDQVEFEALDGGAFPVVQAAGDSLIGNVSNTIALTAANATLTRPNNATAYAAHQGVGSGASCIFQWTNFFRKNGNKGFITKARLTGSVASIATSNMGFVRLHLYSASPASPPSADQQVFNMLVANEASRLGHIDFSSWNIGGASSDMISASGICDTTPLPINAAAAARDLYGIIEAQAAFTPIANMILNAALAGTED